MTTREKLAEAVLAIAGLPEKEQDLIAEEVLERVSTLTRSSMTPAQKKEVKRRLARPKIQISRKKANTFFRNRILMIADKLGAEAKKNGLTQKKLDKILARESLAEGFKRAAHDTDMLELAEWGMGGYQNIVRS